MGYSIVIEQGKIPIDECGQCDKRECDCLYKAADRARSLVRRGVPRAEVLGPENDVLMVIARGPVVVRRKVAA